MAGQKGKEGVIDCVGPCVLFVLVIAFMAWCMINDKLWRQQMQSDLDERQRRWEVFQNEKRCDGAAHTVWNTHRPLMRHLFVGDDIEAFKKHLSLFEENRAQLEALTRPPHSGRFHELAQKIATSGHVSRDDTGALLKYLSALHSDGDFGGCDLYEKVRPLYLASVRQEASTVN